MFRFIGNQLRKPSGFFGTIVARLMTKGNRPAYDRILPALQISKNDRILEIGYGHGLGIDLLASQYDCCVTGVDFSELMFTVATKRNKKHIADNKVALHCGDFLSFTMPPDQFDKIFCINVVYFWKELTAPFTKIQKGLKKGGMFCIHMAHRDDLNRLKFTKDDIFSKYTIEQVVGSLNAAGFADVSYKLDKGYLITCRK